MFISKWCQHSSGVAEATAYVAFLNAVEVAIGFCVDEYSVFQYTPIPPKRYVKCEFTLTKGIRTIRGHVELIYNGVVWIPTWSEFVYNSRFEYTVSFVGPDQRNDRVVRITQIKDLMNPRIIAKAIIGTSRLHRRVLKGLVYQQWIKDWSNIYKDQTIALLEAFNWRGA